MPSFFQQPTSKISSQYEGHGADSHFHIYASTYFTDSRTDLPREAIGPLGSNCFSRGSVPVFLRKHITTCDFRGSGTPGSAHGYNSLFSATVSQYYTGLNIINTIFFQQPTSKISNQYEDYDADSHFHILPATCHPSQQ